MEKSLQRMLPWHVVAHQHGMLRDAVKLIRVASEAAKVGQSMSYIHNVDVVE
jgi:hypothetical protein